MAFTRHEFSPREGLLNKVSYPVTPDNETEARAQMQRPHDQTKVALNGLMAELENRESGTSGADSIGSFVDGLSASTVRGQIAEIKDLLTGGVEIGDLIESNTIATGMIQDGAVTNAKLAGGAVDSGRIADGAVGPAHIAAGAVTEDKINAGAVSAIKLATGAVTEAKIGAGAVTKDKLAADTLAWTWLVSANPSSTTSTTLTIPSLANYREIRINFLNTYVGIDGGASELIGSCTLGLKNGLFLGYNGKLYLPIAKVSNSTLVFRKIRNPSPTMIIIEAGEGYLMEVYVR